MDETTIARFWLKVDRFGPDDCWPWKAVRDRKGYGRFYSGKPRRRTMLAHRASAMIAGMSIPAESYVLHRCDNPTCCNPAHLYIGDHAQNMRDMRDRGGRKGIVAVRGERVRNGRPPRFTEGDIVRIREQVRLGPRGIQAHLAKELGISRAEINDIVRRRRWSHVA